MFPFNTSTDTHNLRRRKNYKVNLAHTETYRMSTLPYLQRRLNDRDNELEEKRLSGLKGAQMIQFHGGRDREGGYINGNDNL